MRPKGKQVRRLTAAVLVAMMSVHAPPLLARASVDRVSVLKHGINITHWFRFVANRNARAMGNEFNDAALSSLKKAGFTYIRLAVGPEEVMSGTHISPNMLAALTDVVRRIEHAGLGVMIEPHPQMIQNWDLQRNAEAREKLIGFWRDLAPALRPFPAALTFPELVNEPSLKDPAQWDDLQNRLLSQVRAILPKDTIVLTGTDWSSIDGLVKVRPLNDDNVVYSFHTYEPQLFALLAFWDPAVNKHQLADNIPFPAADPAKCKMAIAAITDAHTHEVAKYWCSMHADEASVTKNLARAVNWSRLHGVSVAMTEFGASSQINARARLAYLYAVRHSAEKLDLPWALWGLDDQMGFGQAPGGYTNLLQLSPGALQALGLN